MNIVFVKVGTKYNHKHVNALISQLKPFFSQARFVCYTDDASSVECECIPTFAKPVLPKWWNKLALFSEEIGLQGKCVFFDLDSKINFDPTPFLKFSNKLTVMNDYSKKDKVFSPHAFDTYINSSLMCWTAGEQTHIWKHFLSNRDYFLRKYVGIDRFIWNEKLAFETFEDGTVNSVANPFHKPCPIDTWDNLEFVID